jgi:membrane-bound lytic murein transglycosylase D
MRNRLLLIAVSLYLVACATSTPPPVAAPPAPPSQHSVDADEFRKELDRAYGEILARRDAPVAAAPVVDIEAAASIPIPEHRTIASAVRLFSVDMKDSIQESLIRSGRYKNLIDKALAAEKLPKGLAYLPVIESAYLTKLTSRAGAHGIWQFMPDTAREYGLRVDWWIDERADPERSTRAAARYLKDLHRMFDDWSLALAAYNCGPGRVKRTLSETGAATFWELLEQSALPKETRGYVPTFYATLLIAGDPETYGFTLGKASEDVEETRRVELRGPVSLKYIAEVLELDEEVLQDLNPSLRRGVLPPGRSSLRVPAEHVETLAARADTLRHDDAHVKVCTFTLRQGDTLEKLARALGTKPETLAAMNNLASLDEVRRGDTIYVPARARELASLLAHHDDESYFYAVRKGDTLFSIAKRNGLTVAELRDLNDLPKNATLRKGQKLRVAPPRSVTAGGM